MKTAVIGSFVVDLMARTPHLPVPGETVKGAMFRMGAGGKGYNQAVAAAKAGGEVFFSTKVGDDAFSDLLYSSMERNGIRDNRVFTNGEKSTAVALISVDENTSQNEIIVVLGACETLTEKEIDEAFDKMGEVEYILLQLEINTDAIDYITRKAQEKGIKVILNPAPVQHISDEILSRLYAITPNEVEAQILSSLPYSKDEDCAPIASYFFSKGVQNVILTLGKRGAYVNTGKEEVFLDNYSDIKVLDSTGAGDAFNGGLLSALGKGLDLIEAAKFANVVSNLSVTRIGTSDAMPSEEEITSFLETHN